MRWCSPRQRDLGKCEERVNTDVLAVLQKDPEDHAERAEVVEQAVVRRVRGDLVKGFGPYFKVAAQRLGSVVGDVDAGRRPFVQNGLEAATAGECLGSGPALVRAARPAPGRRLCQGAAGVAELPRGLDPLMPGVCLFSAMPL